MKSYHLLLAAGIAAVSSVASAEVVFCTASNNAGLKVRYYTPFIDIGTNEAAGKQIDDAFQEYLDVTHPEGGRWDSICDYEPRLAGSEGRLDTFKYNNQDKEWVLTDFTGGFPIATHASREPSTGGSHLTVKSTTPAVPAGPSATQLSAERHKAVEERNRAAQVKYEAELAEQKRKVEEFERAKKEVARKMEEQRVAAQKAVDTYEVKTQTRAERLRQRELAAASSASGGGRFQATSAIVDTREAAMAALLRQPLPAPLTDIQCAEVKMYSPPKWTCWGFYQGNRKATGASAQ